MELAQVFAKLTGGRVKVLGTLGGLAIAGAVLTAAPAAQAQVAFGVQFGGPRYYAPLPPRPVYRAPVYGYAPVYAPGYWGHRRYEDWRAREWREHAYWEHRDRGLGFYGRGWR